MLKTPPTMTKRVSVPQGLGELELLNIDAATGAAPDPRLPNVQSAASIYEGLKDADEDSSTNRMRIDAMFDGTPPYDPRVLITTGQGSRTNLNFGEAQRLLDVEMSAFVDLYSSLDTLVRVRPTLGELAERLEAAEVIAEELTRMARSWPEFHSLYLRLCTEFIKHGVGVTYFPDDRGWRFRVTGLSDFLVPRQCASSEEGVEVAASRRSYLLHELYAFIRKPEIATKQGWNEAEVKRVMVQNATNSGSQKAGYRDWEAMQRELKNNDLAQGMENTTVSVIHMWVREFDGSISLYLFAEDNPADFLFTKRSMFKSAEQAFIFFTYGVGNNGTLHSIRGKGQRIFAHIQTSNRIRSGMVDAAFLGGSIMLQPQSERALEKLSYTLYGAYSILSPDVDVVEKAVPNLSQAMQPALDSVELQLARNADPVGIYGDKASPYKNEMQVEHDLAVSSRLTGATLNLFYASWTRLWREMTRRATSPGAAQDPAVKELFRRCLERGVSPEMLRSLDHSSTVAVRAIGAGSAANRVLALRELNQVSGGFDETGRHHLLRDIVTARVGRDLTDRYIGPLPEPRPTVEGKIALLENEAMQQGRPVPVLSNELHGEHLRAHAPLLQELISGIETGEVDPMAALPVAEALYDHCSQHNGFLLQDPMAQADAKGMKQLLQQAEMIIVNFRRKLAAMARKAQEGQMADGSGGDQSGGTGDTGPSAAQLKLEEHQVKLSIAQQKAEQEMSIKERKAMQEMALKDAERAMSMDQD
jgi:hypothetical protein